MSGNDDYFLTRIRSPQNGDQGIALHIRQIKIEENQVKIAALAELDGLQAGRRGFDLKPVQTEQVANRVGNHGFIIDNQNTLGPNLTHSLLSTSRGET